jgi:2-C-methyl-D-erythritol 4-phosphate cytidylyltransferase / 2-C-methyl-D-erythritol 2,4-cyclodiphosphate synthase
VAAPVADIVAVLVAAGRARRMGGDKLWLDLWGRPVWRWSLDSLLQVTGLSRAVVVAPAGQVERFRDRIPAAGAGRCLVTEGGETRADSVRAGLVALEGAGVGGDALVLVHDAARPAAAVELMERVASAAREAGAAIPVLPVAETLKRVTDDLVGATVSRDGLATAQTPQVASLAMLLAALNAARARRSEPTDEAQALDALGIPVRAVAGDAANRKLTEAGDEPVLRAILRQRALASVGVAAPLAEGRAGIGFDAHRLEAGRPLRLGGLAFPDEPAGLAGHSDGDVALHAVIDAMLGAARLGDVGSLFPSEDPGWEGADSTALLRDVVARIRDAGMEPRSIDLTIVARRPAIAPVREAMSAGIAALVGVAPKRVSVKGTTSDGLGFAGDEGIAAYAVATVAPAAETR